MDDKRIELWLKLGQFLIGTVVLGIATFAVNSQIQKREVEIKEMEMLGKFVEHAINGNVAVRQRFAEYFATVSRSEEFRNRWNKYKGKIDLEFEKEENIAAELKRQKIKEEKKVEELYRKITEIKKEEEIYTNLLQKKDSLAKSEIKKLEELKIEQQNQLNEVQEAALERASKLDKVQVKLKKANAKIIYPELKMNR